jgi:hypothetical protein
MSWRGSRCIGVATPPHRSRRRIAISTVTTLFSACRLVPLVTLASEDYYLAYTREPSIAKTESLEGEHAAWRYSQTKNADPDPHPEHALELKERHY